MICLKHRVNIAVLVGIASFAFVICPLGFVNAQERDGADARVNRFKAYATEISKAVEAGELTEKEAEKKLIETRQRMFGQPAAKSAEGDKEARIRRFRAYAEEIQKAVDAGDLSEEEAEKKLLAMRKRLAQQPAEKPAERDMDALVKRYKAYAAQIKKAVEAGEVSEEEAEKKLIETRLRLFPQPKQKK
jgi:DNA-binding GntR family transcriptional regulator